MPIRQFRQQQTSEHETLVEELAAEWIKPQISNTEPVILEQALPGQGLAHVYVVWDKWDKVDGVERSEIIMEAAEKKLPTDEVLKISLAMGLTPVEADRMRIRWRQ